MSSCGECTHTASRLASRCRCCDSRETRCSSTFQSRKHDRILARTDRRCCDAPWPKSSRKRPKRGRDCRTRGSDVIGIIRRRVDVHVDVDVNVPLLSSMLNGMRAMWACISANQTEQGLVLARTNQAVVVNSNVDDEPVCVIAMHVSIRVGMCRLIHTRHV